MGDKIRLNITADKKAIKNLKEITRIGTNQELFNNALALFTWVIKEKTEGRAVGSICNDKDNMSYKEIIMPALENIEIKKPSS